MVSGIEHRAATRQIADWRCRYAAYDAGATALHHLNVDAAPIGLVAHFELRQDVGHGGRIKQRIDYTAARLNQAADPVGKFIGQAMCLECLRHHSECPLFE